MKPGNRHENEMVPNHTERKLWKMRDWFPYIIVRLPFCLFMRRRAF